MYVSSSCYFFQSVSAFAPVANPINCPWGQKAFSNYLGSNKSDWEVCILQLIYQIAVEFLRTLNLNFYFLLLSGIWCDIFSWKMHQYFNNNLNWPGIDIVLFIYNFFCQPSFFCLLQVKCILDGKTFSGMLGFRNWIEWLRNKKRNKYSLVWFMKWNRYETTIFILVHKKNKQGIVCIMIKYLYMKYFICLV